MADMLHALLRPTVAVASAIAQRALSVVLGGFETHAAFYLAGSLRRGEAPLVQKVEPATLVFWAMHAGTKLEWVEENVV